MFPYRESKEFATLTAYVFKHEKEKYLIKYSNGETLTALFETAYEDDNGLEVHDPQYECFTNLVFKNTGTGTLFELNYYDIQRIEVYHNNNRII